MKKIFILSCCMVIAGCTTTPFNYTPSIEYVSFPTIGEQHKVDVGDTLVKQGALTTLDGIQVSSAAHVAFTYTILPGQYRKVGDGDGREYYLPYGGQTLPQNVQSIFVPQGTKNLCVLITTSATLCGDDMPFKKVKLRYADDNSFQQALLYNGKVGNKLNIGYREYSANYARPAFNNNVEYDLSDSKVIKYKGAKIEIIDATNQTITYKLISNFN